MRVRAATLSAAVLLSAGPALFGYVRESYGSQALWRPPQVRFVVDPKVVPGLRNGDGAVVLTSESDPVTALRAAMQTWNAAPSASEGNPFVQR